MAILNLVPLAFKNEHKKPHFTTKQNLPTDKPESVAPFSKELKASGMINFKQRMEAIVTSEKATKLITNVK